MNADYSGVVGLAQAVLAVNLAYLNLDRFRYRAEMRGMFAQASELIEGMPEDFSKEYPARCIKAIAEHMEPISEQGDLGSAERQMIGKKYRALCWFFRLGLDRIFCATLAFIAGIVLVIQAYDSLVGTPGMLVGLASVVAREGATVNPVQAAIFCLLLTGFVMPASCVGAGTNMMKSAKHLMGLMLDYLGKRLREERGEDISAKLRAWGKER